MARVPSVGGVRWFGDPIEDESAFMVSHSETKPHEPMRELMLMTALKNGYEDSVELRATINSFALEKEAAFFRALHARGISAKLRALLSARERKKVEQLAAEMVLGHTHFFDLLHNCDQIGLWRQSEHHQWLPDGRTLSRAEKDALFAEGGPNPKLVRKVRQVFEERSHRSVHMFTGASGKRWHCFYMTYRDVGGAPSDGTHHWKGGAHLHLVNYLHDPRNLTHEVVLRELANKVCAFEGLHICFDEGEKRDRPDTGERLYADGATGRMAKVQVATPAPPAR